jgi:hypothetical protein
MNALHTVARLAQYFDRTKQCRMLGVDDLRTAREFLAEKAALPDRK